MVKTKAVSYQFRSRIDSRFVKPVAQEVVSVRSFDRQWEVSTFRTIALPTYFDELHKEIERQKEALLGKNKRKETMEVTGNDHLIVKSWRIDILK